MFLTFWKRLLADEEGNVSLLAAILIPALLLLILYYESEMEAVYVYNQTQFVLDMATRAGAGTGEAVTDGHMAVCTIPYIPEKPEESGYHVSVKVLQDNLHTLPAQIAAQIQTLIDSDAIQNFNDTDLRASGYVQMRMDLVYDSKIPLFIHQYHYSFLSSSRCQAEQTTSGAALPDGVHETVDSSISGWTGPVLTPSAGVNYGPTGKETYYNLPMQGVVQIMREMGFSAEEYPYWVRSDGVKMLGNYVMVAANHAYHPRGSVVETSLGQALVCDTGDFISMAEGDHWLDIAVTW